MWDAFWGTLEYGTVDADGYWSGGTTMDVHQEHDAGGYSESSTKTTTSYGLDGEETSIDRSEQSSFSRTLEWENSATFLDTDYNYTTSGESSYSSRNTVPVDGTPSGENKHWSTAQLENTSHDKKLGGTDFPGHYFVCVPSNTSSS